MLFSMIFLYVAGVIFIYHVVVQFVNGTVYIIFGGEEKGMNGRPANHPFSQSVD